MRCRKKIQDQQSGNSSQGKKKRKIEDETERIKGGFGNTEFTKLEDSQRAALFEHYRRCGEFWRHWTTTIWSIPSVASGINIGAYVAVFTTHIPKEGKILAFGILSLLNLILTLGLWKHQSLQKKFGDRIMAIEEYASIALIDPPIEGKPSWSGSTAYVIAMVFITVTSFSFYIAHFISSYCSTQQVFSSLMSSATVAPGIGFCIILVYLRCRKLQKKLAANKQKEGRGDDKG